jgi:hypothetical protein
MMEGHVYTFCHSSSCCVYGVDSIRMKHEFVGSQPGSEVEVYLKEKPDR